ncbi:hypothetical protein NHX12_005077 [Muraenolepis orangiensis]|uniref:IRG-type G domain-containing protein n=1 Tax=Muraenolepis orangiensis TaxID=630683 RepID=A0A9Q0DTX1_9TELE|nr:hypothetical protein NHX12_005077 [Muraenolepis orangiensis]
MFLEYKAIEDINRALENNDTHAAASISQSYLTDLDSIPLKIAVTGVSGSGKSSFVNAFRGLHNSDERAASAGVVETTIKPKAFPHPTNPNVTFWDLPGIGTKQFPADHYHKLVKFEKFDFYIIVSSDRFRENDVKLAQRIVEMGKTFYFVRAKIDSNLHSEQKSQKNHDEEKTLQEIRENCIQGLKEQGVTTPQVFLVSNFELHLYDFPTLQETMERDLPSHKRDVLILALPNICSSNIKNKKEVLRSQIKFHALISAIVAAIPFPGLSITADLSILVSVITQYLFQFGLDKKSLEKLSSDTRKPLDDLKAVLKYSCSGKDLTK